MSETKPSTLIAGNSVLRSYESGGVHRQASPVQAYYRFSYLDTVSSSQTINFLIPEDIQLLGFYLSVPSDVTITSSSKIDVLALDYTISSTENPLLSLSIPALPLNLGSLIVWEPRFLVARKNWTLFFDCNFNINGIFFYGNSVYIETEVVGKF